jgi:ankyrin repeat protein
MSTVDPLFKAVFDADCQEIDRLLSEGRNATLPDGQGNLLHAALISLTDPPNPTVVDHLIKRGVNVNARDRYGRSPLHYAVRRKSKAADPSLSAACASLLINAGADVNSKDNEGITPIHRSVFECPWNLEIIELLLAAGAKPTERFINFISAVADDSEKQAMLALLLKYGSSGNLTGKS